MSDPTIRAAVTTPALLGECPLWAPDEQVLYWLDIEGRVLHRHDPSTGVNATRGMPGRPGALALGAGPGDVVIAMEHELVHFRWDDPAGFAALHTLEEPGTGNRLNDGRTDPAGRFVVGSMWADSAAGRSTGTLYRVDADQATAMRTDIGCPNGLAFDAGRGRVYWTDTPTERVVVADYDPATGTWENERLFLDYADLPGKPDGACVDAEGGYWSASVYGWSVIRVSPEGTIDARIDLPVEKPSMPAFGGPQLDTLYVTTIGAGGSVPSAPGRNGFVPGSVLAIDGLGVAGLVDPVFVG
ncbi:MAG: SMP-30/gluconolactonase/LRE family protein [Actinomycetota bacterium]